MIKLLTVKKRLKLAPSVLIVKIFKGAEGRVKRGFRRNLKLRCGRSSGSIGGGIEHLGIRRFGPILLRPFYPLYRPPLLVNPPLGNLFDWRRRGHLCTLQKNCPSTKLPFSRTTALNLDYSVNPGIPTTVKPPLTGIPLTLKPP